MTVTKANRLRACFWCGEPGAGLYRAVYRGGVPYADTEPGTTRDIRACGGCSHRWLDNGWRLHDREPIGVEIK